MNIIKENNLWDDISEDFGKIGPNYWNEFGERLIELSDINQGGRVLDIGMGRGASLFPAIDKVGLEGFVFGIDNSNGMVRETNKDLIARKVTNGVVKVMNAEKS